MGMDIFLTVHPANMEIIKRELEHWDGQKCESSLLMLM